MYMLISHIGEEATITRNLQNEDEIYKAMSKANATFETNYIFEADPDYITHRVFKEADEIPFKVVIKFT